MPTSTIPNAVEVVHLYLTRIRARDPEVYRLFHRDAVLNGLGLQTRGQEAIRDFYSRAMAEGGPQPRLAGPLLLEGQRRIAAEIYIDLANGQTLHVIDLFAVEQGLIRSLTYFVASEPSSSTAPSSHEQSESTSDSGRTP